VAGGSFAACEVGSFFFFCWAQDLGTPGGMLFSSLSLLVSQETWAWRLLVLWAT
jgi:hypothetical protein